MQAAMLGKGGFTLNQRDIPQPAAGEVLVKTIGCGVCGGDLFTYRSRDRLTQGETLLGHEGTGTIVALGAGVTEFAVGETVTALGGAYADYFVAPIDLLAKVPAEIDPIAALGEPVACCVHASERFGVREGDRVAVVGCGFMGLICLQLARNQGAGEITAIDPIPYRRDMAARLGAHRTLHPDEVVVADRATGLAQVVIEAGGVPATLELCTDLVTQHGRIIIIGYHESNEGMRNIDMKLWNFKSIDVVNGHVRRDEEKHTAMLAGLEMLRAGTLQTTPLITSYALNEVEQAFADFGAAKEGLFKAVLVTGDDVT
ncbi:MAG: zinc-binding dehydrogenase [Pseudomonadota bacterium]